MGNALASSTPPTHARRRYGVASFGAMVLAVAALAVALSASFAGSTTDGRATAAMQGTVVAGLAALCLVGSLFVLAVAYRQRLAELALIAGGLTMLSGLSVLHGIAAALELPGLSWLAMALAFPAMAIVALPLVVGDGGIRRWVAGRWFVWISSWLSALVVIGGAAFAFRPAVPAEMPVGWFAFAAAATISIAARLAARQLDLHHIGHQRASFIAAVAFVSLAAATVGGLSAAPASPRWWAAHGVNGFSVLMAASAAWVLVRRNHSLTTILAPVLRDDPVAALELGLTPEVHAFIAALDRKDRSTRDHVIRVGDLAVHSARRAGLPGSRLRTIGLGAIMHDIGKLVVPSDILTKPGSLTDAEYTVIKSHTVRGAALLERSPELSQVAPLVRWHHERQDGNGYPDGLAADEIPFEVAIISVCDAWDALTNNRHYRDGRSSSDAERVLRDGAGTQWHPYAVELVLEEALTTSGHGHLADVGRTDQADSSWVGEGLDPECAHGLEAPHGSREPVRAELPLST